MSHLKKYCTRRTQSLNENKLCKQFYKIEFVELLSAQEWSKSFYGTSKWPPLTPLMKANKIIVISLFKSIHSFGLHNFTFSYLTLSFNSWHCFNGWQLKITYFVQIVWCLWSHVRLLNEWRIVKWYHLEVCCFREKVYQCVKACSKD